GADPESRFRPEYEWADIGRNYVERRPRDPTDETEVLKLERCGADHPGRETRQNDVHGDDHGGCEPRMPHWPPNGWRLNGAEGVRCSRGLGGASVLWLVMVKIEDVSVQILHGELP